MNSWRLEYQALEAEVGSIALVGQLDVMIEMQLIEKELNVQETQQGNVTSRSSNETTPNVQCNSTAYSERCKQTEGS